MSAAAIHLDEGMRVDHSYRSGAPRLRLSSMLASSSAKDDPTVYVQTTEERFSNTQLHSLSAFFGNELRRVNEVVGVKLTKRNQNGRDVIHVWTSLSKDDRDTRFRVYEIEERLMSHFHDELFDFHLHLTGDNLPGGRVPIYPAADADEG